MILWSLAAISFAASLGLVWIAWSWMMWGADGNLGNANVRPIYILIFITPVISAAIAASTYQARSRSVWPPIVVALLLPLVFAAGLLTGE